MKSSAHPEGPVRVAVFAKAPVAGQVKTRLAPFLGAEAAAELHAGLVRTALATAVRSEIGPVELWCAPDERHEFFTRCAAQTGVTLHRQVGTDLGARMRNAFERAFRAGSPLLLMGSDCPALTVADLHAAREALRSKDAAIAPAEDGGYVLIALSRCVPALFDGIAWGTGSVMAETRARLAAGGIEWTELPARWDVDRPEDYARLQRERLLEEVLS